MILLKLHQTKRCSYKLELRLRSLAADNWSCKYAGWEILKCDWFIGIYMHYSGCRLRGI